MVKYGQEESTVAGLDVLPINPDLVWDYEIPDDEYQDEAFRRWYVTRVLTRGCLEDIRELGLRTIYAYLPHLILPDRVRRFWEWYFSFPDVRVRHGFADSPAA
jgi:hypothetical protein